MTNKFLLVLLSVGAAEALIGISALERHADASEVISLAIVTLVLAATLWSILDSSGRTLNVNVAKPEALYGFFYALFYCVGMIFLLAREDAPTAHIIDLALLILTGYLGWRLGFSAVRNRDAALRLPKFQPRESNALFVLCWVGFLCVLIGYAWRAYMGGFYTHAGSFEVEANVANSLFNNVTFPFEFPVLILLAVLSADSVVAKKASYSLFFCASVFCLMHLIASEFRLIIGVVVLTVGGLQLARGFAIRWRHVIGATALACLSLLLIQSTRLMVSNSAFTGLDVREAATYTYESFTGGQFDSYAVTSTIERATNPLIFVSNLMDHVESGASFIGADVMIEQLRSLMPRALWGEKPILIPPQIMIKQRFGLPLTDDSPGPLISYYAFGGFAGVFCWLFLFGMLLGWLTNRVASRPSVWSWMLLSWTWGAVIIVEYDQLTYIMVGLRHCIVAYACYQAIYLITPKRSPAMRALPSAA